MVTQPKLILFCGPSGSGKTTLVQHLLGDIPSLCFSISATTRQKRDGEVHGKDYYFLSTEEFKQKIENDEFVEWEEVYQSGFYGTLKSEIERIGKLNMTPIFDVDVEGGLSFKKLYGPAILTVFVRPPSIQQLKQRLKKRATETPESLEKRIAKSEKELTYAEQFDKVITNDKLEDAFKEARETVRSFLV